MNEREKSDRPVLPGKPPNNAAQAAAEVVEGRGLREGNATSKRAPDPEPGKARQVRSIACVESHSRTMEHGSPRCCTTLTSIACGWPTGC